jgi:hypothetical protein
MWKPCSNDRGMTRANNSLQAQVDAQLMEQGAFAPLELLIETGRLLYSDYESWRRREIALLDDVLMGNREKVRAELEEAVKYARGIGLVEQQQELHAWDAETRAGAQPLSKPLRISDDARLQQLIASRFAPAQKAPQMDLFFDNPVVALTNGIVRALSSRNRDEAQRQLDRLYAHAPNHADLGAFDTLLAALEPLNRAADNPERELEFLQDITSTARRLLGAQSRDLLAPLWRQLANALGSRAFEPGQPTLHGAFALSQAQDWPGVSERVLAEPQWMRHAALCLMLTQSGFYRRRRAEALTGWFHLCWLHAEQASAALNDRRQPDSALADAWQAFLDSEDEPGNGERGSLPMDPELALSPADFPAWLLLHEPALANVLDADLPTGNTAGEEHYRCVHRWVLARNAGRQDEEMTLRKQIRQSHPGLFRYLKRCVEAGTETRK